MAQSKKDFSKRFIEWLRNPQVWGFALAVGVIYLLSIAFFYPDNFDGNTLQQPDMQQGMANGHAAQEYEAQTGEKALWTNSLFSGMPTFQISPSYPSNSLFTWIDTVYGGFLPAPSNLLFMMMLGCLILLVAMRMPWYYALLGSIAWGFSSYYVIIIGAGHIWKFITLAYVPPTIAGLVLCYRGRYICGAAMTALFAMMQLNANHPQMSYYFAFVMAGFAIAYLCDAIRQKQIKRWCIASACVLGAGALAVAANLPSIYNTYEYAKETKRAQSELTPLPSAQSEDNATQPRPTGGMPYNDIVGWSYGGTETFSLLIPNIKGGASAFPQAGRMVPATLDRLPAGEQLNPTAQYLMQFFPQYFNDSEGTNGPVYVGAVICALFLLGCFLVRGPLKWVLLVFTVISVLLALGRNFAPLTDFMIYNFPMYNKFRAVESILVIAEFTMPLLAVLGLHSLFTRIRERGRMKWDLIAVAVAFGVPMVICLLFWTNPSLVGDTITSSDKQVLSQIAQQSGDEVLVNDITATVSAMRLDMVSGDAGRSFLYLLWGLLLVLAGMYYKVADKWIVLSVAVVVLFDLYTVDKRYVMSESFVSPLGGYDPYAPDDIDRFLKQDTGHYRVMDIPGFDSPRRSYHHSMIGGYHAAKLNRYEDLIQRRMMYVRGIGYDPSLRDSIDLSEYSPREQEIIAELRADYRVLDMLNARYIITDDPQYPVEPNFNALGNAWLVDSIYYVDNADAEMAALKTLEPGYIAVADRRFASVLGESPKPLHGIAGIEVTEYTPNRLAYKVDTPSDVIAVFSEVWFPWGWHATIDGKQAQLGRVDYVLRAMRVPAGEHTIVMTFDPESLHVTGTVAYASVTIIYMLVLLSLFVLYVGPKKPKKDDSADCTSDSDKPAEMI